MDSSCSVFQFPCDEIAISKILPFCLDMSESLFDFASVAQLVEQLTLNQLVWGSSPHRGTIFEDAKKTIEV